MDFQLDNVLVSLKAVDSKGSTWLRAREEHIIDLGTRGATVDGNLADMALDLRVQPGGVEAASSLVDLGEEWGVAVFVQEFK